MPETAPQPDVQPEVLATGDIAAVAEEDVVEESLVEEVSIDGMCGVY
jgi:mycofactocin precursor